MFKPNILFFTLLHSEWPKLYGVLAVLSAIGLKNIHHFVRAVHQSPRQRGIGDDSKLGLLISQ